MRNVAPNRHFGLFVHLGLEFRNFIHSGLSNELLNFAKASVLTYKPSDILKQELNNENIQIIQLPSQPFVSRTRRKYETWFLSIRRAVLRKKGNLIFRLMGEDTHLRVKDQIIGNKFFYWVFKKLAWKETHQYYFDQEIAKVIEEKQITDIVIQSYFTIENMVMAITAKKMGCKIWVVNWGWKDFYFHEYIPFKVDGLFTWSEALKQNYQKFNSHILPANILGVGNLSFDSLFNYEPNRPLSYYSTKYGFQENCKLILYTLVHPAFHANEQLIIQKIASQFKENDSHKPFVFLLKPNPMDKDLARIKGIEKKGEIIVLENLWVYDKENDFNMVTHEGQIEWLDLIYYSSLNISVASTVTAECLIMKTPVINILFEENDKPHVDFIRFYEAPFYQSCHQRSDVLFANTKEEVANFIHNLVDSPVDFMDISPIINPNGQSVSNFIEKVKNV
jgi:hypothetical protein